MNTNSSDLPRIDDKKWAAIYAAAHEQARSNPNEVLYAVDRDAIEVVYREEGEPEHVEPLDVLDKYGNLAVVHSHPDGTPPSSGDFGHLIDNDHIRQVTVVTQGYRYTLEKPVGWSHEDALGVGRRKFPDGTSVASLYHNNLLRRERNRLENRSNTVSFESIRLAMHLANKGAARRYRLWYEVEAL